MENLNAKKIGDILIDNWNNPTLDPWREAQTLELKPKIDTVYASVGIEKYDNPIVEIIEGEIVVKLGKVKIGGVK